MGDRLINEGLKTIFLLLWLGANVGYWIQVFWTYEYGPQYFYIRRIIGPGVSVAKACGACLNLNSMLILLPVCRNLISFLRGSCETNKLCRRSVRRQLDKNLTFHKTLAYMITLLNIVHCIAHFFNFRNLYDHFRDCENYFPADSPYKGVSCKLRDLEAMGGTWINPVRFENKALPFGFPLIEQGVIQIAGWSGVVLTLVFIIMFSSATEFIRRSYFETFWVTHHLFVIYFAMLLVHGVGGVIRSQNNLAEHNITYCSQQPELWTPSSQPCPYPNFVMGSAASWKWCVGPIAIYILERFVRFIRSCQKVQVIKVVKHPSKVIELQMKKSGFKMLSGQYVFLKCPALSHIQWHPFTLTSAPEDDFFSIHIRTVGDWTTGLAKVMGADNDTPIESNQLARVAVDGPFGTASLDVFKYQAAVCVGAGIGVTPFASILRSIWHQSMDPNLDLKLKKVYFFWICPDTNAFEWFSEMLDSLENHMIEQGKADFLKYNIYLTRGWNTKQAKNIYLQEEEEVDAITGLKQKTNYGRPKWDDIFKMIAEENPGTSVGVFFCGPKVLSQVLHKCSNKHSNIKGGARFFYNKENF
ncbi:cytochrome b-245 heavy chain-like isoform X1 [Acanthaster planci]|uniref:Cytochrome b-245 heavy chain-like isoform X1 n=2 Tax=Acanthaster planci TaxID=133434 RepID=A0A8B7XNH2_ACAPL|nr:cytochrome b-245 heavy chain-like isoform X1 [Acanthaster planci]